MDGVTALPQLKSVAATAHVLMVTMHEPMHWSLSTVKKYVRRLFALLKVRDHTRL